jgi:hypothetical protein
MVDELLDHLDDGDCIKSLDIIGHGKPGEIGVGDGRGNEEGKHIDGDEEEWGDDLARLRNRFCDDAEVRLLGCNTGVCDKGASKLYDLAQFLGVTVTGTTRDIYPDDFDTDGFDGDDDDIVSVGPDDDEPDCMASDYTKGLKKDETDNRFDPEQADILGFGFRDVLRYGLPSPLESPSYVFRDSRLLHAILNRFDFSQAYVGANLGARIDALIHVLYRDLGTDTWEITLDFHGLVIQRFESRLLYLTKEKVNVQEQLSSYLALQEAADQLRRDALGNTAAVPKLFSGSHAISKPRIIRALIPSARHLKFAELLKQPVTVLLGVTPELAQSLDQLFGVKTIAQLAKVRGNARIMRIARAISYQQEKNS